MKTELADQITKARGERTHLEFAYEAGCSMDTVYRWERGETIPRSTSNIRFLVSQGVPKSLIDRARAESAGGVAA